jgi:hypothetical protein
MATRMLFSVLLLAIAKVPQQFILSRAFVTGLEWT